MFVRLMAALNRFMTAVFDVCFAPMIGVPGWVSLFVFSTVSAVGGLLVYKYTSNQVAITRTKDRIKAGILAIKLFRDELGVIAQSLGTVVWCAVTMLRYALLPLAVMIVPFALMLAQLGLRYQWRPVVPGESVVVTVQLAEGIDPIAAGVSMEPDESVVVEAPPVRIPSERRVVWRLHGVEVGRRALRIVAGDEAVVKTLDVGEGFERANSLRSRDRFWSALLYPAEEPLPQRSRVSWVRIAYPDRESVLYGSDYWLIWLLALSFVIAFLLKPVFRVEF